MSISRTSWQTIHLSCKTELQKAIASKITEIRRDRWFVQANERRPTGFRRIWKVRRKADAALKQAARQRLEKRDSLKSNTQRANGGSPIEQVESTRSRSQAATKLGGVPRLFGKTRRATPAW